MLDIIGAFALSAVAVVEAIAVIGGAAIARPAKTVAYAVAGAWLSILVALGATGHFAPGALAAPAIPLAFAVALVTGILAWTTSARFRAALLSVPLTNLAAVHASRLVAVFFIILFALGRLPAPFALSAGIGDILTAIGAIAIAARLASGRPVPGRSLVLWNAFGALDLFVAMTLGALSVPGPIQIFGAHEPNAMTAVPWVLVPTLLVPFYLQMHLTIATRISAAR